MDMLRENNTDIIFGIKNVGNIGIISSDKVIIEGGTIQQYLMADGSISPGAVSTIGTDVEDNVSYDVLIQADNTNDALQVQVTGVVGETLRWTIHIEGVEIAYGT